MTESIWANLSTLWNDPRARGMERLVDSLLIILRIVSMSYILRRFLPSPDGARQHVRDGAIELYSIFQLAVLASLTVWDFGRCIEMLFGGYILFDIYLNLLNIIFIGKFQKINYRPSSIERNILLLFLNIIDVVLAFGIFYQHVFSLAPIDAVVYATLVLGTIGYPPHTFGWNSLLVVVQIFLDLILLVLLLGSFIGNIGLFRKPQDD